MRWTGDGLFRLFSQCNKLKHVELEEMDIRNLQDDWLLWPRFFVSLRTQVKQGGNSLKSIKFFGWFDIYTPKSWERNSSNRPHISHMGDYVTLPAYNQTRQNNCAPNLGQWMEEFVFGKTSKCLWIPVQGKYPPSSNPRAALRSFIDDNLAQKMESEIENHSVHWWQKFPGEWANL